MVKLFAETFSIDDPNPGNNEARLDFDVRTVPRYLVGDVTGNTIPIQKRSIGGSNSQWFNHIYRNGGE